jgi:hypothetical protein
MNLLEVKSTMKPALLDVNVLVAMLDAAHPNHDDAHGWFGKNARYGWATAPITINGCIRVLCNPAYKTIDARPEEVAEKLRIATTHGSHCFWRDDINLIDPGTIRPEMLGGHKHVTDAALLALAVRNGGRLATFDRSIPLKAVLGAKPESLEVISGLQSISTL